MTDVFPCRRWASPLAVKYGGAGKVSENLAIYAILPLVMQTNKAILGPRRFNGFVILPLNVCLTLSHKVLG